MLWLNPHLIGMVFCRHPTDGASQVTFSVMNRVCQGKGTVVRREKGLRKDGLQISDVSKVSSRRRPFGVHLKGIVQSIAGTLLVWLQLSSALLAVACGAYRE